MFFISVAAAIGASFGWATGIVLAHFPARAVGVFEFTRIQLVACSAIMAAICSVLGYWPTIIWSQWPLFAASIGVGIVLGNLAMIECLRCGGPRRTELLLSLKAPIVGLVAYIWLGETLNYQDIVGIAIVLAGITLSILFGEVKANKNDTLVGGIGKIVVLGISAAAFQGLGFLLMKPAMLAGTEPLAASAVRLLGAAFLISIIALWPARSFRSNTEMTPLLLFRTILPGFIGYGISSSLMLFAYANLEGGVAAVLGSLSPILVLPIIWMKDRQPPNVYAVIGALIAVAGIAIILLY